MVKTYPEHVLNPGELPNTTDVPPFDEVPPKQLPKPLSDFKQYVDSKFCYFSKPMDQAELISTEPKIAYQCRMKILMEKRSLHTDVAPHPWHTATVLGSSSLGRFFESTERSGEAIGNIWSDYQVDIPDGEKFHRTLALTDSIYYTRCWNCRAKRYVSCTHCTKGLTYDKQVCYNCKGAGEVICKKCKGLGGFRHTPKLTVKWSTRSSTFFYQNSFLHKKRIRKGQRTAFWSTRRVPWSKSSSIEDCVQSINEEVPDIPLQTYIVRDYTEKHLNPMRNKNNAMRRFECFIERMGFEEVHYTMGENYSNKRDSKLEHTFRFCQYPGPKGQNSIYEDDYPLNCCGCFGEKMACYSSCCTIL
ncbi:unnamed protein product [Rotaria socialis]|uniref:Uncharacterized protein n=1 Tax=Rotaria socialis TaxID=392032 RepID=A0A820Y1F7_9BILA|nr:unnamed protein product [Rotaria socialis]CAF3436517.1 unnamed protein product [Rotaria socialis]CAF3532583.1 unnamed protein product [Rotaria socialis]CAF3554049.1 unnamed protein product [Rotaria socialis]CAF4363581.1 unnamed protein product [Rotaria socialis]